MIALRSRRRSSPTRVGPITPTGNLTLASPFEPSTRPWNQPRPADQIDTPALPHVQISLALPWFLTTRAALKMSAGGQEPEAAGEGNGSAPQTRTATRERGRTRSTALLALMLTPAASINASPVARVPAEPPRSTSVRRQGPDSRPQFARTIRPDSPRDAHASRCQRCEPFTGHCGRSLGRRRRADAPHLTSRRTSPTGSFRCLRPRADNSESALP